MQTNQYANAIAEIIRNSDNVIRLLQNMSTSDIRLVLLRINYLINYIDVLIENADTDQTDTLYNNVLTQQIAILKHEKQTLTALRTNLSVAEKANKTLKMTESITKLKSFQTALTKITGKR